MDDFSSRHVRIYNSKLPSYTLYQGIYYHCNMVYTERSILPQMYTANHATFTIQI